jgi:hypothetical protein
MAASLAMLQVNLLLSLSGRSPDSFVMNDLMRLPLGILSELDSSELVQSSGARTLWQERPPPPPSGFLPFLVSVLGAGNSRWELLGQSSAWLSWQA